MGKKTRRIKTNKKGDKYVYSYSHRYDKKEKKTKQGTSRYLGKFDGTYDKDGNPNYIPSRSTQPIELKKFWDIFQQSIEKDELIKNKKILYFVIKKVVTPNLDFSQTEYDRMLKEISHKQFFRRTEMVQHLDKICLNTPVFYSNWFAPLESYLVILVENETKKSLQFVSSSQTYFEQKIVSGGIQVLSGNAEKLMENMRYDRSKDFVIISKDSVDDMDFTLWFRAYSYYIYSLEQYPFKGELTHLIRRVVFFEEIFPILLSLIFECDVEEEHDYSDFLEVINMFAVKLYEIFSSTKKLDFMLIRQILEDNPQFVKIKGDWVLLDERATLSQKSDI